jgi:hypothetical protein
MVASYHAEFCKSTIFVIANSISEVIISGLIFDIYGMQLEIILLRSARMKAAFRRSSTIPSLDLPVNFKQLVDMR